MTRGKQILIGLTACLAIVAALGFWQRNALLARWHVRELIVSKDESRDRHIRGLIACGADAITPLLANLTSDDATCCRNLEAGLRGVIASWSDEDPRLPRSMEQMRNAFGVCSLEGRKSILRFATVYANRDDDVMVPPAIARLFGELVELGEREPELRPVALNLAGALLEHSSAGQWQPMCRGLAVKWLADPAAATRIAAIQIALREPLRKDSELLRQFVPHLGDTDAGVRRVALLALSSNGDVVSEERLLPLLHDADSQVQRLCESVLRSRGLSDPHIRMARLITDESPAVRLQVIPLLRQAVDLDTDVWLRRLTLDPAPAVRAAAARFASIDPSDDLRHRLAEMARVDPSPTVREIARFYVDRSTVRPASR